MRIIFATIFFLLLFSCAGSITPIYEFNYKLTSKTANSKTTNLSVKIPDGWFEAEDNECNCTDLWLVKDDYSASLNFTTINITNEKDNVIKKAVGYSKIFVRAKLGLKFQKFFNEEVFEVNKNKFYAFEYYDEENRNIRIIVFKHKGKFYELKAIPSKSSNSELFIIQNSVITSLK